METIRTQNLLAAALVGALAIASVPTAQAQTSCFDELANLPFAEGRPTKETAQTLRDELATSTPNGFLELHRPIPRSKPLSKAKVVETKVNQARSTTPS